MKVHLGEMESRSFINKTLNGFLMFDNQQNTGMDDGKWALRVEDIYYGINENSTSLDDPYSDLAIFDTMFPGIMVPNRVWNNFRTIFM